MDEDILQKRIRFTELLNTLSNHKKNISTTNSFAIKNYHICEEMFDCLLNELTDERSSSLYRKNLFILLDMICYHSRSDLLNGYTDCFEKNITTVLDAVLNDNNRLDRDTLYIMKLFDLIIRREWFGATTNELIRKKIRDNEMHKTDVKTPTNLLEVIEEERDYQKKCKELLWIRGSSSNAHEEMMGLYRTLGALDERDKSILIDEFQKYRKSKWI